MLEKFTQRARRVITLAAEEARHREHAAVGTEHLLMAMLRDGEGLGIHVLERLSFDLDALKREVEQALAALPQSPTSGDLPFTPRLKRVLELSFEERRELRCPLIGTEHLLLGLIKEDQAIRGVSLEEARSLTCVLVGSMCIPVTDENVRFIATSKWRIRI
jgi:ATP-dependent Clp protease ATP-binding subunit ClpC